MKKVILAFIATMVLSGSASAQVADVTPCGTSHKHNWLVGQTYRYSVHNGDYVAYPVRHNNLRRMAQMRSCAKHTNQPNKYKAELHHFREVRTTWRYVYHIDVITVYGKWAVPTYVVMHESGGNFGAVNSGGCGGPGCYGAYQIGNDHWYPGRVCAGLGKDPGSQHVCAYRVLHSEGSRAWSTW